MPESGQNAGLTLESCNAFRALSEHFGQQLDRDTTAQLRVYGLVNITHSTGADMLLDLVMCGRGADHQIAVARILSE